MLLDLALPTGKGSIRQEDNHDVNIIMHTVIDMSGLVTDNM